MKRIITLIISTLMIITVLGLTACGSKDVMESKMAYAETTAAGYVEAAYAEEAIADEYGAYDLSNVPSEATAGFDGDGSTTVSNPNRKLIKTVNLDLETKQYDTLLSSIKEKINAVGGYIENSSSNSPSVNSYGYNQSRYSSLTVRVPSDKLDEFVEGVSAEGNVTYKGENVQDITLQYTDTESRKKSLQTEQDRLNELMKQAETVEDLISIEERLSEVRYQLESIESQLRTYDNQVDYSTVYIGITEVVEYTPQAEATIGERISEGFNTCINGLADFFEGLLVFVIAFSPLLLLIAAVVAVIVIIVKKNKKKKLAKKEAEAVKKAEEKAEEQ